MSKAAPQEQFGRLLAQVDAASIPQRILLWLGGSELPDGTAPAPPVSQHQWQSAYLRLAAGCLDADGLPQWAAVQQRAAKIEAQGEVPLLVVSAAYARLRDSAGSQIEASFEHGRPLPQDCDRLDDVLESDRAFMAAPLLAEQWGQASPRMRGLRQRFRLDPDNVLQLPSQSAPMQWQFDPGDGAGARELTPGVPFDACYPRPGPVLMRLSGSDGQRSCEARFVCTVDDDPPPPAPDTVLSLRAADSGNTGRAAIYFSGPDHVLRRPLLLAEGFPGGYSAAYQYDVVNQHGMLETLRGEGFDIVLLGFDQGWDAIERNAGVVRDALAQLAARKPAAMMAGGLSMGGLVVRQALLEMECAGDDHGVQVYLTIDTPHQGAYTGVANQWLAQNFADVSPDLAQLRTLLDTPANQQFVKYWVHDGEARESPLRKQFVERLAALGGYPGKPLKLAVSCGGGSGVTQPDGAEEYLDWRGGMLGASLKMAGAATGEQMLASGYNAFADGEIAPLRFGDGIAWDALAGGQNVYNEIAATCVRALGCGAVRSGSPTSCTVPAVSALDLDVAPGGTVPPPGPHSPFDDYVCNPTDQLHLSLSAQTCDWIVTRLQSALRHDEPEPMNEPANESAPSFDPHDPAFQKNPYPTYTRMRKTAAVSKVGPYGAWWVFGYDDCMQALEDKTRFVKVSPVPTPPTPGPFGASQYMPQGMFSSDPPWHDRLRGILAPLFRDAISGATEVAEQQAEQLLAQWPQQGRADLITAYALNLPARVLFTLMGLPPADVEVIVGWVTAIVRAHDITQPLPVQMQGGTCAMALSAYYQALLRRPPQSPPRSMLDLFITRAQAEGLSADEIQPSLTDITVAGYLSTTYLIATGLGHLLDNADQRKLLEDQPQLWPAAIEEMLRIDAPAQIVDRYAAVDLELGGQRIAAGDRLSLILGSANHDERKFDDPDAFRVQRDNAGQLGFGWGIHHCIGAPLARAVTPVALMALLKARPDLRVDGMVQWQTDPYLRGPSNMPLAW